jgi:tRNA(adenine34) deaminase
MQEDHQYYMNQCLDLAKIALAAGDPPVGAIIVLEGKIIGSGIESGRSTGDVTNHAEILAVREAVKKGFSSDLHLATMYTTHEPCIMCSYVIRHYKIPKLVYGITVPVVGGLSSRFDILITEDVPKWGSGPQITGGICLPECEQLNEAFGKILNK